MPFIISKHPEKVYTFYRLEVPVISQTLSDSQSTLNATGISNMAFLDIIAFKKKWGLFGIGPVLLMPTASPEILETGKWSAGPVGVILYTKIKKWQFGMLVQQFFHLQVLLNRKDVNFMIFQPIINKIFTGGYFMQFTPIMKFDWKSNEYNVPVSLAFGKAFAKNLSMYVAPQYVATGPGKKDFSIILNINAMFASM